MSIQTTVLCPVDFSPTSLGALHHALAIARRYHATLVVLSVDDPLLSEVGDARMGMGWSRASTERALREFVADAQGGGPAVDVRYEVRSGKVAPAIRDVAQSTACVLIAMGTHGRSGVGKLLFGSTAERVLRETTVPVLLAPSDPGPLSFDDLARWASPILVPVDFSAATAGQVKIAGRIAEELHAHLIIGHVLEPIDLPVFGQLDASELMSERYRRACRGLHAIAAAGATRVAPEILIATGNTTEQIAQWAQERRAGLLVMALHSDPNGGPRMGSVTYRATAATGVLTLALPPAQVIRE